MAYEAIQFTVDAQVAWITLNRPDARNAINDQMREELFAALAECRSNPDIRVVVLTAAGKGFCTGADIGGRGGSGPVGPGAAREMMKTRSQRLIRAIWELEKPVIAAVNGVAVGGGHVLHVLCDLTVASTTATFGQAGPRVGSFDAGFGSAYLARVVGEKRARQIWFLLERLDAETAERWGLVNLVVEPDQLLDKAVEWGTTICSYSPTAIRFLKHSFNADTDHQSGVSHVAFDGLEFFVHSEEGMEGAHAFAEKRPPDFSTYR